MNKTPERYPNPLARDALRQTLQGIESQLEAQKSLRQQLQHMVDDSWRASRTLDHMRRLIHMENEHAIYPK